MLDRASDEIFGQDIAQEHLRRGQRFRLVGRPVKGHER